MLYTFLCLLGGTAAPKDRIKPFLMQKGINNILKLSLTRKLLYLVIYEWLELCIPLDSQEYRFCDPMPLPAFISVFWVRFQKKESWVPNQKQLPLKLAAHQQLLWLSVFCNAKSVWFSSASGPFFYTCLHSQNQFLNLGVILPAFSPNPSFEHCFFWKDYPHWILFSNNCETIIFRLASNKCQVK